MRNGPNLIPVLLFVAAMCYQELSLGQVCPVRFRDVPNVSAQQISWSGDAARRLIDKSGMELTGIKSRSDSVLLTARFVYSTKPGSCLFPLDDSSKTSVYWGKAELAALQNLNASISTDGFSLYSELVSDYFVVCGRWLRVGFGGLLSYSDTSKAKDSTSAAIQRLLGGGGNALLHLAAPILFYRGTGGWGADLVLAPKLTADLPALNADMTKFSGSIDLGVEEWFFISSVHEKFSFFLQGRLSVIVGTDEFHKNLGRSTDFGVVMITMGLNINNTIRLTAANIVGGPLAGSAPWRVGVQVLAGG
jgi:hypothetical protein